MQGKDIVDQSMYFTLHRPLGERLHPPKGSALWLLSSRDQIFKSKRNELAVVKGEISRLGGSPVF